MQKTKTSRSVLGRVSFIPMVWIILLWGVFSAPYFLKGNIPFPTTYLVSFFAPWNTNPGIPVKNNAMPDVITQIYPWKKFTIDTWKMGQIPLWNPYSFSGTVHAANYQTAVFSPMNLLFFALPMVHAWSVMVLLQPILAGLGMLLYLKTLNRTIWGQTLGSVSFMFCSFMVTWMAYGTLGFAVAVIPFILWGIEKYSQTQNRRYGLPITLGLVFSYFSGHFQMSLYVTLFVFVYSLFMYIASGKKKEQLWLFVFLGFSVLIALPQFWLSFDAFFQSFRQLSVGTAEIIPWKYIITFFSPDFFGNPVTRNDTFGHYAEWGGFVGVIPFLLSLFTLFTPKTSKKTFFIVVGVISLFMAYASPLSSAIFYLKIPVLSTSAASRIIVLVSFSLSVLSSFGLDDVTRFIEEKNMRLPFKFGIGIVLVLCIFWILMVQGVFVDGASLQVAKRNTILPSVLTLVFVGLSFLVSRKFFTIKSAGIILLVILSSFDLIRFASKWMPFESQDYLYPHVSIGDTLQKKVGIDRVYGNIGNEFTGMYALQNIEGYDALYQKRYGELIKAGSTGGVSPLDRSVVQLDKHGKYANALINLLGVRIMLHRLSDGRNPWAYPVWEYPSYSSIYKDNDFEIFENSKAVSKAQLISRDIVKKDSQDILSTLFSASFDPAKSVVLETTPVIPPQEGKGTVAITSYTPNYVNLDTDSPVAKMLVLQDTFENGWKAYVDGKLVPILRANYDFRAVSLPAGKHHVQFRYQPRGIQYGLPLALMGSSIFLVVVFKKKLV